MTSTTSAEMINGNEGAESFNSHNETTKLVALRCAFKAELKLGETLVIVGSTPLLGKWKAEDGFRLSWTEGNVWRGNLPVERDSFEFKLVVAKKSGETFWEKGENRKMEKTVMTASNAVEVKSTFGKNAEMEVSILDGGNTAANAGGTVQSNVVEFAREGEEKMKEENVAATTTTKPKTKKSTATKKKAASTGAYRTVEKVKYDNIALLKFDELMEKNSTITADDFKAIYPEDAKMKAVEKRTVEFLLKGGGGKFSYSLSEEAKGYGQLIL